MAVPGWPELAFWTASIESVRMVLTQSSSSVRVSVVVAVISLLLPGLSSGRGGSITAAVKLLQGEQPRAEHAGVRALRRTGYPGALPQRR